MLDFTDDFYNIVEYHGNQMALHPTVQQGSCEQGDLQCSATGGSTGDDSKKIRENDLGLRKFLQFNGLALSSTAWLTMVLGDFMVAISGTSGIAALFLIALIASFS